MNHLKNKIIKININMPVMFFLDLRFYFYSKSLAIIELYGLILI
jgi:hypothetical protein